jgi:hypothetical protein
MKAPRFIAAFVCLLLAFTLFQSWMWHWRPEPGWQPSWWQSHTLAAIGAPLSMPAMIPALILQSFGVTNTVAGQSAIAFGFIIEIALTYFLVYFIARFLLKRRFRADKTVV